MATTIVHSAGYYHISAPTTRGNHLHLTRTPQHSTQNGQSKTTNEAVFFSIRNCSIFRCRQHLKNFYTGSGNHKQGARFVSERQHGSHALLGRGSGAAVRQTPRSCSPESSSAYLEQLLPSPSNPPHIHTRGNAVNQTSAHLIRASGPEPCVMAAPELPHKPMSPLVFWYSCCVRHGAISRWLFLV